MSLLTLSTQARGWTARLRRFIVDGGRAIWAEPSLRRVIVAVIALDAVVLALAASHSSFLDFPESDAWGLDGDRNVGERWLDVQLLLAAGLLVAATRRTRLILAATAVTLAMFVLDNVFQGHERIGFLLADRIGLPALFGLRDVDLGELMVFGFYGVVVLTALALTWRGSDERGRLGALSVAAALAMAAFFAVVVDLVHSDRDLDGWTGSLFDAIGAVEDGGEILGASVVVIAALMTTRAADRAGSPDRSSRSRSALSA